MNRKPRIVSYKVEIKYRLRSVIYSSDQRKLNKTKKSICNVRSKELFCLQSAMHLANAATLSFLDRNVMYDDQTRPAARCIDLRFIPCIFFFYFYFLLFNLLLDWLIACSNVLESFPKYVLLRLLLHILHFNCCFWDTTCLFFFISYIFYVLSLHFYFIGICFGLGITNNLHFNYLCAQWQSQKFNSAEP